MPQQHKILLSFDVEEFDLPLEYGDQISSAEQLQYGRRGLETILPILDLPYLKTTVFTTACFANENRQVIKSLSEKHEIASHTFYHTRFETNDLKSSKQALENITGKNIYGLRMPRMQRVDVEDVKAAGYLYNSSINPTWIPGRYNNLRQPRLPFMQQSLLQFPVSVTPGFRIPLFWLAFKNLPYPVFYNMLKKTLKHDGFACLYFHPWEFIDITSFRLPFYVKTGCKKTLLQKLKRLVIDLSQEAEFISMKEYIDTNDLLTSKPR